MSMNAALTSLYILTAPDMPKQLYLEEGIEAILECLRFNLMSNILAFSDIRILQASRPDLLQGEGGVKLPFKISQPAATMQLLRCCCFHTHKALILPRRRTDSQAAEREGSPLPT